MPLQALFSIILFVRRQVTMQGPESTGTDHQFQAKSFGLFPCLPVIEANVVANGDLEEVEFELFDVFQNIELGIVPTRGEEI